MKTTSNPQPKLTLWTAISDTQQQAINGSGGGLYIPPPPAPRGGS